MSPSNVPDPRFWIPDEQVTSLACFGDTLYVGGNFRQVGPSTGPFVPVDALTGLPNLSFPRIDGDVYRVIPDGQGGWFVGGYFDFVGELPHACLARIHADGSVDSFQVDTGPIHAMYLSHGVLYLGGNFNSVNGIDRKCLAAVDSSTGAVLPWNPSPALTWSSNSFPSALLLDGATLYVAGNYTFSIGTKQRSYLAAIDATSGAVLAFDPKPDNVCYALELTGGELFVGGAFQSIANSPRQSLAAFDRSSGSLGALSLGIVGPVETLAASNGTLYFGGGVSSVDGAPRGAGAAVDLGTGTLLGWDPKANNDDGGGVLIHDLVLGGSQIYVAGSFRSLGVSRRLSIGAVDSLAGVATGWIADAAGPGATHVYSLAEQSNGTIGVGGHFQSMGGAPRESIAALDIQSGALETWHPSLFAYPAPPAIASVYAIAPTVSAIFVGGRFASVDGSGIRHLAALDPTTGAVLTGFHSYAFHPTSDSISALWPTNGALYIGGTFGAGVGLTPNLAKLDLTTGLPDPNWIGTTNGQVSVIQTSPDHATLFVGGQFSDAGSPLIPRTNLAAFDAQSGALSLGWNPAPNGQVRGIVVASNSLFVAGWYSMIGSQSRFGLAELDLSSGSATTWSPAIRGGTPVEVDALAAIGDSLFVGGNFTTVGGGWDPYLTQIDAHTAAASSWSPGAGNGAMVALVHDGVLYIAGNFTTMANTSNPFLVAFDLY